MSENEQGPPATADEVWRGRSIFGYEVAVDTKGGVVRWDGHSWRQEHPTRAGATLRGCIAVLLARAEKAEDRAERAEKARAGWERTTREAEADLNAIAKITRCKPSETTAESVARALGVEP